MTLTRTVACLFAGAIVFFACASGRAEEKAQIIVKYDFDDGKTAGAEGVNAGTSEITSDTFDGSGSAVKTVNDKQYLGLSWYMRTPIQENNTLLVFAYKVTGIKGNLFVQCGSPTAGNLHAEIKPTVFGDWAVGLADMGKLVDWGSKYPNSKGQTFRDIQIYGGTDGNKGMLFVDNLTVINGTDRNPPTAPKALTASIVDFRVRLSWQRAEDETFVKEYEAFRGATPDFTPTQNNMIGRTQKLAADDDTISNFGTFYYKVRAIDALGNVGPFSDAFKLTVSDQG
jgi:hypothetical protein